MRNLPSIFLLYISITLDFLTTFIHTRVYIINENYFLNSLHTKFYYFIYWLYLILHPPRFHSSNSCVIVNTLFIKLKLENWLLNERLKGARNQKNILERNRWRDFFWNFSSHHCHLLCIFLMLRNCALTLLSRKQHFHFPSHDISSLSHDFLKVNRLVYVRD
jgi:hypothetical protein